MHDVAEPALIYLLLKYLFLGHTAHIPVIEPHAAVQPCIYSAGREIFVIPVTLAVDIEESPVMSGCFGKCLRYHAATADTDMDRPMPRCEERVVTHPDQVPAHLAAVQSLGGGVIEKPTLFGFAQQPEKVVGVDRFVLVNRGEAEGPPDIVRDIGVVI